MKKNLLISFILLVITGFSLFPVELYGYVKSVQTSNYEQQKIVLNSSQPVIGIISGAPVLLKDIHTLMLDAYSSSIFSALLHARANNWCVKFTIGEYIDNGIITGVEIPCSMVPENMLIAEYLFNGNTEDTSGYSNHLENYNNTRIVNGFALFDGDDDGLGLEYLNNFNKKALTITVWIKAKMGEGNTRVVEIGENWEDSTVIAIDSDSGGTLKGFRYCVHLQPMHSPVSILSQHPVHVTAVHLFLHWKAAIHVLHNHKPIS
ncbi:MAG: hypothetical protein JXB88_14555 [Spirochaetales bacterium]|nr:hypothetical protein [Spirochaetales bacterium]